MVSRSPPSSLSRRGLLAACAAGLSATAGCTSLTGPRNVTADWPTRGRTSDRTSRATDREGPTPPLDVAWTAEFLGTALGGREGGDGVTYHTAWGTLYAVDDCEASVGGRCLV